jgi:uncharacterized delta-60 repeat protein
MVIWRYNADGTLDTTFGVNGFVVHGNAAGGFGDDSGKAIALDPSGRIVVAGRSRNRGGDSDMVIWRYNADGSPDTTFGTNGIVLYGGFIGTDLLASGNAIALDSSGRIVVAGNSVNFFNPVGKSDMVIWRYNADGTRDTTFGANGIVAHNNAAGGFGDDSGNAIALDSSGRIIVAGRSQNAAGGNDMVIWRYNADGTPDTAFGTNGIAVYNNAAGGTGTAANVIVLDSSGRIVVAGISWNRTLNYDMMIWRYNADGTPDTTFGTNGIVMYAAGGIGDDYGNAIALDSSGRIVAAGKSLNAAGNSDMVIWRYNADGTPDTTFDADGIVHPYAAGGSADDSGNAIALDSSGRILVTGMSENAEGNGDMVICRYNADGTLDTTFGANGIVVHNNAAGGNGVDSGNAIVLDSSGRIVVAGSSWNGTGGHDMAIWRYNADGTPDPTFGTNVIVASGNTAGLSYFGSAIALDLNGRIVVVGHSMYLFVRGDMVIWRYNADGTPDTTFGTNGIVLYGSNGIVLDGGGAGTAFFAAGNAIALDPSGRIVVAGSSQNGRGGYDMAIWRYNADGTPDTTFGVNGIVVHDNAAGGNGAASGNAITLDSSGKIVVAGKSRNTAGNDDMVIWRYNSDGTLETTFGANGIVVHDNAAGGNGADSGKAIALDSNGRILVTGSSSNAARYDDMAIWRYNADGTLDAAFGANGIVVHDNAAGGNGFDSSNALALDSNGRVLVAGTSGHVGGSVDMVIWRYNP